MPAETEMVSLAMNDSTGVYRQEHFRHGSRNGRSRAAERNRAIAFCFRP
jgi:hypothetical protein